MKYQYILFDLDGTLTDPKEGITKCIRYALADFGVEVADLEQLVVHIGPPLYNTFHDYYGMNEEDTKQAIAKYRERFSDVGLFENKVYDGIIPMLEAVKATGKTLAVATSKPEVYTERILERFGLTPYFDVICGSTLDGSRDAKADVIREVIRRLNIEEADREQMIMIGDRKHDVIGAKECGLDCIGVEFGYAEENELKDAGAAYIVNTVDELKKLLMKL